LDSSLPVYLDTGALEILAPIVDGPIVLIAGRTRKNSLLARALDPARNKGKRKLSRDQEALFLEVVIDKAGASSADIYVHGMRLRGRTVLQARGPGLSETIAAVLLHIRDVTGLLPVVYLQSGTGWFEVPDRREQTARVTEALLAAAEPDVSLRPKVDLCGTWTKKEDGYWR
jgi:hypothetical protein